MQEAHTRSANRAPAQMRINSVAHALELEPRVMLESALRGRLFDAGARRSRQIETLACEFIHAYPLARMSTPQEMELYLVRWESGKE